jgi:two-component system phosphate regulon sensor histidine kinase PhoR
MNDLQKLADLLLRERTNLLDRWRREVRELPSAKQLDTPTLNDHLPRFIDQMAATVRLGSNEETIPEAANGQAGAADHGLQRLKDGFNIVEVVAEYNILRGCIHDVAAENGLLLRGEVFHVVNRVIDAAIGAAVENYSAAQALEILHRREEYLAFIVHDLRTPLNAIGMVTKLLKLKLKLHRESIDPEIENLYKTLNRNIEHLSALVTEVLKKNSDQPTGDSVKLQPRVFDLWPLVEGLIHELNPIADTSGTRLINEVPPNLRFCADASLLTRVIQNLIVNAITHTPRGNVVIGARDSGTDGAAEFWVSDNGSGIPADQLPRIFDKYETDHKDEQAAGLGLAIVKAFVEAHDGNVNVESEPGRGCTFRISLPAAIAK